MALGFQCKSSVVCQQKISVLYTQLDQLDAMLSKADEQRNEGRIQKLRAIVTAINIVIKVAFPDLGVETNNDGETLDS